MMKKRQKLKKYDMEYKKIDKDSDYSEDDTELQQVKTQRKEIPSVEKDIQEGDSLQSLAIRYHCTVEDLKRLNNVEKENEIFAKRTIKVPYRPFTMALAGVHLNDNSPSDLNTIDNTINIDEFHIKLNEKLQNEPKKEDLEVNNIIFNSNIMQNNCERVSDVIETECCEEEVQLLHGTTPIIVDSTISKLNCSGADGDISWIALVICICVVIVAVPLIYVLYIAEHPEQFEHHSP